MKMSLTQRGRVLRPRKKKNGIELRKNSSIAFFVLPAFFVVVLNACQQLAGINPRLTQCKKKNSAWVRIQQDYDIELQM